MIDGEGVFMTLYDEIIVNFQPSENFQTS